MNKKIEINNIFFSYGYGEKNILNSISFNIYEGKLYSIIGPNGSGKTTLLKLLSNQLKLKNGSIILNNKNLNSYSKKIFAQNIAIVPQNNFCKINFLNKEIVMMGRTPYLNPFEKEKIKDRKKVEESMIKTETSFLENEKFKNISGGEQQRVIIARALAQDTKLLFLDEPISQLDIKHQINIMNFLNILVKEEKYTIIIILHDLNIASQYSDELIFLNKGKLIKKGIPEKVLTKKILFEVYNLKTNIIKHPKTLKPFVLYAGF